MTVVILRVYKWIVAFGNFLTFQNDEDVVRSLIDLTNMLNTDMQKAIQFYNPMFEK